MARRLPTSHGAQAAGLDRVPDSPYADLTPTGLFMQKQGRPRRCPAGSGVSGSRWVRLSPTLLGTSSPCPHAQREGPSGAWCLKTRRSVLPTCGSDSGLSLRPGMGGAGSSWRLRGDRFRLPAAPGGHLPPRPAPALRALQ